MQAAVVRKGQSVYLSWLFWLGNAVVIGSLWCLRWVWAEKEKKSLTRAEEKQRRKALVRDLGKRR
jgi:hypothetical protein